MLNSVFMSGHHAPPTVPERFTVTTHRLLVVAVALAWSVATPTYAQQATPPAPVPFAVVQDTVANPIRMGCGERVDPVGYVLYLRDDLGLNDEQVGRLVVLDEETRARTLPLAARWRAAHEGSLELREVYRSALVEIERVLTDEQLASAMAPITPTRVGRRSPGMVRCFLRSHLVIIR